MNLFKVALAYAQRGWKVFPVHRPSVNGCSCGDDRCKSPGKHPRIAGWQAKASSDIETLRNWWGQGQQTNMGILTGRSSGLVVVDIDPRHGGGESLEELDRICKGSLQTLRVHTGGGGQHLYFQAPAYNVANRAGLLPGIDIRGDGGFVVAPPSLHHSGKVYRWQEGGELQAAPAELLDLLSQPSRSLGSQLQAGSATEGQRNSFLTQVGGRLRREGQKRLELETSLKGINKRQCSPPLGDREVEGIARSLSRYPAAAALQWPEPPEELPTGAGSAPAMESGLIPELMRPWALDVSERMQVAPEFFLAPAIVAFSSVVGRRIAIRPKRHDSWLVVPNLWGAIVARPGYFKSPTISEALAPLERISDQARQEHEANKRQENVAETIAAVQVDAIKDAVKKAMRDGNSPEIERLREELARVELERESTRATERRYKTNDATVEKVARLLGGNPNGILLLRDELNGWLQTLSKAGREGDREFYLEAWNGYGSYTVDRVGAGTIHVPALCLSVFGGIQPGKLKGYVEKALHGAGDDDGLLQRFQVLIYPDLSPEWVNVDREPNASAREQIVAAFERIAEADSPAIDEEIPSVRFSPEAQELFNSWRSQLERRLRSGDLDCPAFESHLAKYRSLMPSLALLFWLLEDPQNISGRGDITTSAARQAIAWCGFLEQHARKAYALSSESVSPGVAHLAKRIRAGGLVDGTSVRDLCRKQWRGLKTRPQVDAALHALQDLSWLQLRRTTVQGGKSQKIHLHPQLKTRPEERS